MASPFIFELLKKETAERRELNIAYSDEAKPGPLWLGSASQWGTGSEARDLPASVMPGSNTDSDAY